jgi:hypothetical protein
MRSSPHAGRSAQQWPPECRNPGHGATPRPHSGLKTAAHPADLDRVSELKVPIMSRVVRQLLTLLASFTLCAHLLAQTPQPFPRPGGAQEPARPVPAPSPSTQAPPSPPAPGSPGTAQSRRDATAPAPSEVGFPIYPAAQFLASYDAGRGQRYYIYGVTAPFTDVVNFYRMQLDERGSLVFKEPPTHMFEIGRFREETMAFPPGVTVKDWTWGGSQGYLNPQPKAEPRQFPTIVMIVPPAPQAAGR